MDSQTITMFWSRVDKQGPEGCWLWIYTPYSNGYGQFYFRGFRDGAHRVSWELEHGPIPDGLCVLHSCDVRLCVNPKHLWLGTKGENNRDRHQKGRSDRRHGERNPAAKLCAEQVEEIRASENSSSVLAARYGVTKKTIDRILSFATWKELR